MLLLTHIVMASALAFDAGADLRIRQELMENIPGSPNGGLSKTVANDFKTHLRFRPRVWGEVSGDAAVYGKWRIFTRLTDEFRWNIEPNNNATAWPGEVILDNLFVEGKGIFDGLMDLKVGRQDLFNYCGLDHLFMDGTPGDGSRTTYTDMASVKFNVDEDSSVDLFGLYNLDNARDLRWGYDHQRYSSLAARFPDGSGRQDDWGYGAVWTSKINQDLKYQVFAAQKQMLNYGNEANHCEVVGTKVMPRWTDTLTSAFEAMAEMNGAWSGYADIGWKSAAQGPKPFARLGYHYMSAEWDPMWSRSVNDSEMFLYGTHNGITWWTNMHFLKLKAGYDFGAHHSVYASTGPMFAADRDRVGGGDGFFKGMLTQARYDFPIMLADKAKDERFEIFGHVVFEYFNPGDYYASKKSGWFFRWQLEFKF